MHYASRSRKRKKVRVTCTFTITFRVVWHSTEEQNCSSRAGAGAEQQICSESEVGILSVYLGRGGRRGGGRGGSLPACLPACHGSVEGVGVVIYRRQRMSHQPPSSLPSRIRTNRNTQLCTAEWSNKILLQKSILYAV